MILAHCAASIEKINERLGKIEAKLESQNSIHPANFNHSSTKTHPSQEKFAVTEAVGHKISRTFRERKTVFV